MVDTKTPFQVTRLLLEATYSIPKDGGSVQFLFGKPGAPASERRMGAEIFFSRGKMIEAALALRDIGPSNLKTTSIPELWAALDRFLTENFWLVCQNNWGRTFDCSFAERVSFEQLTSLAYALSVSDVLAPKRFCSLFPLVPIGVDVDFSSEAFFLCKAQSLTVGHLRVSGIQEFAPDRFPPMNSWNGPTHNPQSWLGIHAYSSTEARRMRNAILGAASMLPSHGQRYLFSHRKMFGGQANFVSGCTVISDDAHTPPLADDITLRSGDHDWLTRLAGLLQDSSSHARRSLKSLEYVYRAWFLEPVERFPVMFMALDAVFGAVGKANQSAIEGIRSFLRQEYDEKRIRHLLSLRAAVIHGGAPDLYDSNQYFAYFSEYSSDPILDIQEIATLCIQGHIFGETQQVRPNPYGPSASRGE